MQLSVIFDTNIYGKIVLESSVEEFIEKIKNDKDFIVYGFGLIRKELRDTPKSNIIQGKNARIYMLGVYDSITSGRYLENSAKINHLAKKFYDNYRTQGGIRRWHEIETDLTIVSCACMFRLDVVYSDDNSTLASKQAQKAYKHIAFRENFKVPNFYSYKDLKEKFKIK